ncbi:hypothetical protein AVEN_203927-1 [Araneus ventricosus]|uniref:Uncharacterized protein n=1 Tax=Araneus ventricosus TaxID=182803 RepID=A0A4Y2JRE0_ARAVE|nr:hypothetical protein AVEN_203927-1 [Araneus ventricosus]
MVVCLFGPISEDMSYPDKTGGCDMRRSRNEGYNAGISVPDYAVVAAGLSCVTRMPGDVPRGLRILLIPLFGHSEYMDQKSLDKKAGYRFFEGTVIVGVVLPPSSHSRYILREGTAVADES